jgi:hypothetical protein
MRQHEKWFAPVFVGIIMVASVAAGACGDDPALLVLSTAADSSGSDSIPGDSTPPDSVPPDSIPPDSIPPDTLPPPSGPASITVTPHSQERAVGDSGWVTATVRDSAGREIWTDAIEWDLTDTSSVLRITTRSSNVTVFDAVGPGRAVLIARFQTLADTAIVFVRTDSTPPDTVPPDTIPPDSIPPDTLPPPSGPASITVTPDSQERAVGDSGWVTATVRDSAGREIWPAAIEWDLRDTSSVLRITTRSSNIVIFDAVRPGRARLIARHEALADTAVVVVR